MDLNEIDLGAGDVVDWRVDLVNKLEELAQKNETGHFWANTADRWNEGDTVMVTAYVLKSLKRIRATL